MNALKVFVAGEGVSDIGNWDRSGLPARERVDGFIPPLLRKLLGRPIDIKARKIASLGKHEDFDLKKMRGQRDRAAKALALASTFDCALVVFVKDVDRQPATKKSSRERRAKLREMHDQIDEGFASVPNAEEVLRVKATPCRMIESWALGDGDALAKHARKGAEAPPPTSPEDLWGLEANPRSNHPKCVLQRVLGREVNAALLGAIASDADPARLRQICPDSFEPFAEEVMDAASRLPEDFSLPPSRPAKAKRQR